MTTQRPLNIAFVIQRCGAEIFGGAERYILEVATACSKMGANIEIFTSQSKGYIDWKNDLPTLETHSFQDGSPLKIRRFPVLFSRFKIAFALTRRLKYALGPVIKLFPLNKLCEQLFLLFQGPWCPSLWRTLISEQKRFDLIVCGAYLYAPTAKTLAGARETKTLLIPMAHDEREFFLPFVQKQIQSCEHLGYLSLAEKNLVESVWPTAQCKQSIFVHPGINETNEAKLTSTEQIDSLPEKFFVYVGRVDPHKGINFLVNAISENIPIVFAGDVAMLIPEKQNRIFLGRVSDAMRDDLIKKSIALVIASRFESYSMVTADALAMGKPVLALKGCGPIDELIESYGGLSVSDSEFADWAERLYRGEELPHQKRPNPGKIRQERSWSSAAGRILQLAEACSRTANV